MGGRHSTPSAAPRRVPVNCPGCGAGPHQANIDPRGLHTCRRCGSIYNQTPQRAPHTENPRRSSAPSSPSRDYEPVPFDGDSKDDLSAGASIAGIVRIHIAPIRESLNSAESKLDSVALISTYLQPFFNQNSQYLSIGSRFRTGTIEWKVTASHPPAGIATPNSIIQLEESISTLQLLNRITVLPTLESIHATGNGDPARWFETLVKPYLAAVEHRQMSLGETFMSKGVQFKVVECIPSSGVVHERTEIFCNGQPLSDVTQVRLLPVYESLPNRDKNLTPLERFKKYLEPYFLGCSRIVNGGDELTIDGVDFKVVSCLPGRGIVTLQTAISTDGNPLRADELKAQQMAADEEYARQLQRQEGGPLMMMRPMPMMPPPPGPMGPMGPMGARQGSSPAELRGRLQEILRQMPPNDPHRPVVQRLHDQLLILQMMPGPVDGRNVLIMPGMSQNHGVHPRDIEALPTREYPGPPTAEDGQGTSDEEKSREHLTCMVCLMEYEKGDVLRTLPCFHSYHRDCIDKWLSTNSKCPVCKTPVV